METRQRLRTFTYDNYRTIMRKRIKPTASELEILNILWESGPSSVRDVHTQLSHEKDVFYTTTLKTMQVMTDKGLLTRDTSGRAHIYSPAVNRDAIERNLLETLRASLFKGSTGRLVISALGHDTPSASELEEIRKIIDELDPDKDA